MAAPYAVVGVNGLEPFLLSVITGIGAVAVALSHSLRSQEEPVAGGGGAGSHTYAALNAVGELQKIVEFLRRFRILGSGDCQFLLVS